MLRSAGNTSLLPPSTLAYCQLLIKEFFLLCENSLNMLRDFFLELGLPIIAGAISCYLRYEKTPLAVLFGKFLLGVFLLLKGEGFSFSLFVFLEVAYTLIGASEYLCREYLSDTSEKFAREVIKVVPLFLLSEECDEDDRRCGDGRYCLSPSIVFNDRRFPYQLTSSCVNSSRTRERSSESSSLLSDCSKTLLTSSSVANSSLYFLIALRTIKLVGS
jgi:hypothetical protein